LGERSPDVAGTAASLAYWLIDAGQYTEASDLLEESLSIRRQQLGATHPGVATTLIVKSALKLAQHRYAEAEAVAKQAEEILAPGFDASDWRMAMAMNAHGAALTGLRRYPEAEKLLKDSQAALKGAPLSGQEELGRKRLADLYTAWGKPDLAQAALTP